MKTAKRKLRIYEVPISYHGRTYEEGKKIGWKDGIKALGVILKFWLIDDLYATPYGRAFLNNLTGTPQYLSWVARVLRPYIGDTVLEVGAGIGNISARLMVRRLHYIAAEKDPLYLHALSNRFLRTPNVSVRRIDPESAADFEGLEEAFDTVLCVNVLEYVDDLRTTISLLRRTLKPGGILTVLVPQGPALYGSLDRAMGHKRRFRRDQVLGLLLDAGFKVERSRSLNKISAPSWWINSRVLGASHINKVALKIFDKTVWIWRRIDWLLPWRGLSLILVARK
jgi:SAM-dependent methyltransferase